MSYALSLRLDASQLRLKEPAFDLDTQTRVFATDPQRKKKPNPNEAALQCVVPLMASRLDRFLTQSGCHEGLLTIERRGPHEKRLQHRLSAACLSRRVRDVHARLLCPCGLFWTDPAGHCRHFARTVGVLP